MPITPTPKIWMSGRLVDWEAAQIHVLTHSLHYGTAVFEGIRAYDTGSGPGAFRLTDHLKRLQRSAKILGMPLPFGLDDLAHACLDTVASTGLASCYVRVLAYLGYGEMGLNTLPCGVEVAIACWPWPAVYGADNLTKGARMKVSSWQRHDHNTMPPAAKVAGGYVNSSLAKVEALKAGYDDAIILNRQGLVSECAGENIFAVRDGTIVTPPTSAGALEGITQDTVRRLAADLGIPIRSADLARSDLYIADELFISGTAAEITAVRSVDDRDIACPGPVTTAIAAAYARAVRRQDSRYAEWVELCRR